MYFKVAGTGSYDAYYLVQLNINGSWTTIFSGTVPSSTYVSLFELDTTQRDLVTGLRVQIKAQYSGPSDYAHLKIYDISIFE